MSISIPTTMKFIVRGKSVDFKNREGSSPSIPNPQKSVCYLFILSYPLLFVSGSKFLIFLVHPILFHFTSVSEQNFVLLSQVLWYIVIYIWYRYKSTSILEQGIPIWMIHNPYHYSYWNLQSLFFEDPRNSRSRLLILFRFFVFVFNWHRPKSSSIMRIMCR